MERRLIISNVKGRYVLSADAMSRVIKTLSNKKYKQCSNFVVWHGTYTYTVFYGGTVNVTGIKSLEEVKNVLSNMCSDFEIDPSLVKTSFIIDSSTATGDFQRRLDLTSIQRYLMQNSDTFTINFNREVFCSLYCYSKRGGTVALYASGKYNILGTKTCRQMQRVAADLTTIVLSAMSNTGRGIPPFIAS